MAITGFFYKSYILFILLLYTGIIYSQKRSFERSLEWSNELIPVKDTENKTINMLYFNGAVFDENLYLPVYNELIPLINNTTTDVDFQIDNLEFIPIGLPENKSILFPDQIVQSIKINYEIVFIRKKPYARLFFIPIRKNPSNYALEKLKRFSVQLTEKQSGLYRKSERTYKKHSVLFSGQWTKIGITKNGVYKITYEDLVQMGFSQPQEVRIFGNGGAMLPFNFNEPRYDDLEEIPTHIEKGKDGLFNSGDYVFFYCSNTTQLIYDSTKNIFFHKLHLFSDTSYYFITVNNGISKPIITQDSITQSETHIIKTFDDYQYYEKDSINLIRSGRTWYGENFGIQTSHDFHFFFPNLVKSDPVFLKSNLLSRSSLTSPPCSFNFFINQQSIGECSIDGINLGSFIYAYEKLFDTTIYSFSDSMKITIQYNKSTNSSEGWLDYIQLNAQRELIMYGKQMIFKNVQSAGTGNISLFTVSNTDSHIIIWDITDPLNPIKIRSSFSGSDLLFKSHTDSLREFIAFSDQSFPSPFFCGSIGNQDLHGIPMANMVIVSHPDFLEYAHELADIHRKNDSLQVEVVTSQQIYNEFSSGMPDVSAIKGFIKMLYDRAGTNQSLMPDYLLLFGDGSYDNKTKSMNNPNYILTYQSENSLNSINSIVSDDYFGLLDDDEPEVTGYLDIGIGRLPVKSKSEARAAVDKIKNYISVNSFGEWRNTVCFIADDEDNNNHMYNSNFIASNIETNYPVYNIDKIFLDAFPQVSTTQGKRYPAVNDAINNRMNKGALIMDYTGHGSEFKLGHEWICTINDVIKWENIQNMPFFVTASCEVGRFDDYSFVSLGENIFLNPRGGGIGALTTTRLVYAGANFILSQQFYSFVFSKDSNNRYFRIGDIVKFTKLNSGTSTNKLNFTLLGDPALKLSYPKYKVITSTINHQPVSPSPDTLKALTKVTVTGYIQDNNGTKAENYNGKIFPVLYDKKNNITTLANDGGIPFVFPMQNSLIYRGNISVVNGQFEFSFMIPKDIQYHLDFGKISYYTHNISSGGNTDAAGYFNNFIIGGIDTTKTDQQGPVIKLYMNDSTFVYGGFTDENPVLIAHISDSSGLNFVSNGIGHDMTSILDDQSNNIIVLNDYFMLEQNSYQKGKVNYSLCKLSEGVHSIRVKAWDVFNNASEETIEFTVMSSSDLNIDRFYNYPNPFSTRTLFYFTHNQANSEMNVIIQIFTVSGKLIKTIQINNRSQGYLSEPIEWDGLDDFGNKTGRGVYFYNLKIRSSNGKTISKLGKIMKI